MYNPYDPMMVAHTLRGMEDPNQIKQFADAHKNDPNGAILAAIALNELTSRQHKNPPPMPNGTVLDKAMGEAAEQAYAGTHQRDTVAADNANPALKQQAAIKKAGLAPGAAGGGYILPENVGIGALPERSMANMADGGIIGFAKGDLVGPTGEDLFAKALQLEGITDPKVISVMKAIHQRESGGRATSPNSVAGAAGPMQVMPATFNEMDRAHDLIRTNSLDNMRAGMRYVKQGYDKAGGDPALTGAYYVGGPEGLANAKNNVARYAANGDDTLKYGAAIASQVGDAGLASLPGAVPAAYDPAADAADARAAVTTAWGARAKRSTPSVVAQAITQNQLAAADAYAGVRGPASDWAAENIGGGRGMAQVVPGLTPTNLGPGESEAAYADDIASNATGREFALAPEDKPSFMAQLQARFNPETDEKVRKGFEDKQRLIQSFADEHKALTAAETARTSDNAAKTAEARRMNTAGAWAAAAGAAMNGRQSTMQAAISALTGGLSARAAGEEKITKAEDEAAARRYATSTAGLKTRAELGLAGHEAGAAYNQHMQARDERLADMLAQSDLKNMESGDIEKLMLHLGGGDLNKGAAEYARLMKAPTSSYELSAALTMHKQAQDKWKIFTTAGKLADPKGYEEAKAELELASANLRGLISVSPQTKNLQAGMSAEDTRTPSFTPTTEQVAALKQYGR